MIDNEVVARVYIDKIFNLEEIKDALNELDRLVKDILNYKDDYFIKATEINGKVYLSVTKVFNTENKDE